jgi:hypothetical protein
MSAHRSQSVIGIAVVRYSLWCGLQQMSRIVVSLDHKEPVDCYAVQVIVWSRTERTKGQAGVAEVLPASRQERPNLLGAKTSLPTPFFSTRDQTLTSFSCPCPYLQYLSTWYFSYGYRITSSSLLEVLVLPSRQRSPDALLDRSNHLPRQRILTLAAVVNSKSSLAGLRSSPSLRFLHRRLPAQSRTTRRQTWCHAEQSALQTPCLLPEEDTVAPSSPQDTAQHFRLALLSTLSISRKYTGFLSD